MSNKKNLEITEIEALVEEEELTAIEVEDADLEVIENCENPEPVAEMKKKLAKLGIGTAVILVLVAVWKKAGKAKFESLLASVLRKSGYTVIKPGDCIDMEEIEVDSDNGDMEDYDSEVEDETEE